MKSGVSIPVFLISLLIAVPVHAVSVRTSTVEELAFFVEQSAPAKVINYDHSLLSAQIEGRVLEVAVRVGDQVAEGQTLVRLECSDYEYIRTQASSAVAALDARLQLARQQLKRAEKLLKQRNASQELRDQRRAELSALQAERRSAEAAVSNAKLKVSRCKIKAPFAGTVTERPAMLGSLASVGTPLVKVLSGTQPEVSSQVPAAMLASLQQASVLYLLSDKTSYPLEVRVQLPLVNSSTRTREVRLNFTDRAALTGTSGRLVWRSRGVQIPAQYAVKRNNVLGLMIWQQGVVQFLPLPDALEGQALQVDLPADAQVIIEGQHGVQNGDRVERLEQADAATTAE